MTPLRQILSRLRRGRLGQGRLGQGRLGQGDPSVSTFTQRVSGLRMRDRVVTAGLWFLLVLGPVLSLMALQRSGASADVESGPEQSAAEQESGASVGPAGFAARFVATWLSAGRGEEDQVRPYYPAVTTIPREPATQQAASATVVEALQVQPGYWQVTTAAELIARPDTAAGWSSLGTQCFMVGVLVSEYAGRPTSYTASALPALVGCPPAGATPAVDYGQDIPVLDGPLVQAIGQFLAAYLTGVGELSRYTAPTVELAPVTPAPYAQVTVTGLRAATELTWDVSAVPPDGTVLDVLITVDALPAGGGLDQLTYALSVLARDGRWELAGPPSIPVLAAEQPPPREGEDK